MDESNLPQEAGIEVRAVSYTKGCYVGQEVLNRLHTLGHVNKALRSLHLPAGLKALPAKGDKLFYQGKEVGYITSATASPTLKSTVALGYVRREANQVGTELAVRTATLETPAAVVAVPFSSR
jgi:folate-binding protein YgfZ